MPLILIKSKSRIYCIFYYVCALYLFYLIPMRILNFDKYISSFSHSILFDFNKMKRHNNLYIKYEKEKFSIYEGVLPIRLKKKLLILYIYLIIFAIQTLQKIRISLQIFVLFIYIIVSRTRTGSTIFFFSSSSSFFLSFFLNVNVFVLFCFVFLYFKTLGKLVWSQTIKSSISSDSDLNYRFESNILSFHKKKNEKLIPWKKIYFNELSDVLDGCNLDRSNQIKNNKTSVQFGPNIYTFFFIKLRTSIYTPVAVTYSSLLFSSTIQQYQYQY